jgi:hypothetical protein
MRNDALVVAASVAILATSGAQAATFLLTYTSTEGSTTNSTNTGTAPLVLDATWDPVHHDYIVNSASGYIDGLSGNLGSSGYVFRR